MAKPKKSTKKATKSKASTQEKAKPVKDLSQTHGHVETNCPTTLDQIWGDDGTGRYRGADEEAYIYELEGMNRTDLQMHAHKMGLLPIDNRGQLMKRLIREYKKHHHKYAEPPKIDRAGTDIPDDVLKILREGR